MKKFLLSILAFGSILNFGFFNDFKSAKKIIPKLQKLEKDKNPDTLFALWNACNKKDLKIDTSCLATYDIQIIENADVNGDISLEKQEILVQNIVKIVNDLDLCDKNRIVNSDIAKIIKSSVSVTLKAPRFPVWMHVHSFTKYKLYLLNILRGLKKIPHDLKEWKKRCDRELDISVNDIIMQQYRQQEERKRLQRIKSIKKFKAFLRASDQALKNQLRIN